MDQDFPPNPPSSEKQIPKISQSSAQQTPFEVLKTKVYPVINQVILKLIDHIVQSHQVEKHEERLQKKKLVDQLQRKYLERDIEKEQMGSDYQQSDDEEYHRKLEMKKDQVQKMVRSRIEKHKINPAAIDQEFDQHAFNPIKFIIKELRRVHYGEGDQSKQKYQKKEKQ